VFSQVAYITNIIINTLYR